MKKIEKARVYRFHDLIALTTELEGVSSKTVYLDQETALHLARALATVGRDVIREPSFPNSRIGTLVVEPVDPGTALSMVRLRKE